MTEFSKVEQVAKAICEGSGDYCFQREVTSASGNCVTCLNQARAAIQALREPTQPMLDAGLWAATPRETGNDQAMFDAWGAMIDAALKETTPLT